MASKKPGFFITFEGGEGCGKSTQVKRLIRWLKEKQVPYLFTLEPGGTQIGEEIRHLLLDPSNKHLSDRAELLLYEADRAQHVEELVQPALNEGKVVVCDRFFDSSTVYQGICRKLGESWVSQVNRFATGGLSPDLTFLLDLPVSVGRERVKKRIQDDVGLTGVGRRVKLDRIEREDASFHRAVRNGFLKLAKKSPSRFKVINAAADIDAIEAEIQKILKPRLQRRNFWKLE